MREEEGYPDHGEKDGSGTERYLGRCGVRGILCDSDDFNGRIQRGESVFPPLRFLGFGGHHQTSRWLRENGAVWRSRGGVWIPVEMGAHRGIACLVRMDPFGEGIVFRRICTIGRAPEFFSRAGGGRRLPACRDVFPYSGFSCFTPDAHP